MRFSLDKNSNELVEKKLRKLKNVLVEYMHFERSIGLQNVDVIKVIEMVLNHYSNNEIPKKELQQSFNKLPEINLKQLKKVMT
jgi:hypothetical protein